MLWRTLYSEAQIGIQIFETELTHAVPLSMQAQYMLHHVGTHVLVHVFYDDDNVHIYILNTPEMQVHIYCIAAVYSAPPFVASQVGSD